MKGIEMKFFSWLIGRTPRQSDPAPQTNILPPLNLEGLQRSDMVERAFRRAEMARPEVTGRPTKTPRSAPPTPIADTPTRVSATLIRLPDVFCMLEYCDAEGVVTRRRVTLKALDYARDAILKAYCHERKAARTFRLDRVVHFITTDGEIIDPARYCDTVLGLEVSGPAFHQPGNVDSVRRLMAAVATPMTILVAVARADGDFATAEIDRIEAALERELAELSKDGRRKIEMQLVLDGHLARIIRDSRPTQESLRDAARKLVDWPAMRIDRLSRAITEVVRADGVLHRSELDAVTSIADFARAGRASRLAYLVNDMREIDDWQEA